LNNSFFLRCSKPPVDFTVSRLAGSPRLFPWRGGWFPFVTILLAHMVDRVLCTPSFFLWFLVSLLYHLSPTCFPDWCAGFVCGPPLGLVPVPSPCFFKTTVLLSFLFFRGCWSVCRSSVSSSPLKIGFVSLTPVPRRYPLGFFPIVGPVPPFSFEHINQNP